MGDGQAAQSMAQIIAKAWADAAFKARLIAEPAATLRAEGIAVPDGVTVRVVEDTPALAHLVLPPPPADGEISEDRLGALAGGVTTFGSSGGPWISAER